MHAVETGPIEPVNTVETDETVDGVEPAPVRSRWRRPALIVALVVFLGAWVFAFVYDATRSSPEPLDTASFDAAASACRAAITSLSALTPLPPSRSPTVDERTTLVHDEDAILTEVVTKLDAVRPTDHDGAKAIAAFAADWRHLTAARETYAAAVSAGGHKTKLVIPVDPEGKPITIRMREYAEIHHLTACTPNALQGEVVEGPRTYPRA